MAAVKLLGNDDKSYAGNLTGGYIFLSRHQAVDSGTFNAIKIYFTGATTAKVALYSDISGPYPGVLLSKNEDDNATVDGWVSISMPEYSIVSGNYYWLAVVYPSSSYRIRNNTGTGQPVRYKSFTYSGSFLDEIPSSGYSSATSEIAIAGWGEASGGGVQSVVPVITKLFRQRR